MKKVLGLILMFGTGVALHAFDMKDIDNVVKVEGFLKSLGTLYTDLLEKDFSNKQSIVLDILSKQSVAKVPDLVPHYQVPTWNPASLPSFTPSPLVPSFASVPAPIPVAAAAGVPQAKMSQNVLNKLNDNLGTKKKVIKILNETYKYLSETDQLAFASLKDEDLDRAFIQASITYSVHPNIMANKIRDRVGSSDIRAIGTGISSLPALGASLPSLAPWTPGALLPSLPPLPESPVPAKVPIAAPGSYAKSDRAVKELEEQPGKKNEVKRIFEMVYKDLTEEEQYVFACNVDNGINYVIDWINEDHPSYADILKEIKSIVKGDMKNAQRRQAEEEALASVAAAAPAPVVPMAASIPSNNVVNIERGLLGLDGWNYSTILGSGYETKVSALRKSQYDKSVAGPVNLIVDPLIVARNGFL